MEAIRRFESRSQWRYLIIYNAFSPRCITLVFPLPRLFSPCFSSLRRRHGWKPLFTLTANIWIKSKVCKKTWKFSPYCLVFLICTGAIAGSAAVVNYASLRLHVVHPILSFSATLWFRFPLQKRFLRWRCPWGLWVNEGDDNSNRKYPQSNTTSRFFESFSFYFSPFSALAVPVRSWSQWWYPLSNPNVSISSSRTFSPTFSPFLPWGCPWGLWVDDDIHHPQSNSTISIPSAPAFLLSALALALKHLSHRLSVFNPNFVHPLLFLKSFLLGTVRGVCANLFGKKGGGGIWAFFLEGGLRLGKGRLSW